MKTRVTIRIQRGDYEYDATFEVDEEKVMASNPYTGAAIEQAYLGGASNVLDTWMQVYLMGQLRKELGRKDDPAGRSPLDGCMCVTCVARRAEQEAAPT